MAAIKSDFQLKQSFLQKGTNLSRFLIKVVVCFFGIFMATPMPVNSSLRPAVIKDRLYEIGIASYYGRKFQGQQTASGEEYDMHAMTAAHPDLKFGSWVEVTNLKNERKVMVRINDRGPFVKGRVIDLSFAAAKKLGLLSQGLAKVSICAVQVKKEAEEVESTLTIHT